MNKPGLQNVPFSPMVPLAAPDRSGAPGAKPQKEFFT